MLTVKTCAKTFKIDLGVQFVDTKTIDKAEDLQQSLFLSGTSMYMCFSHTRIVKFVLRCPAALRYIEMYGPNLFRVTHCDGPPLISYQSEDAVYLLKPAWRSLTNRKYPKGEFPVNRSIPLQLNICGH